MKAQLANRFGNRVKGVIERYEFEVGILKNTRHKSALPALKSYAGGPARKTGVSGSSTTAEVSRRLRSHLGFNYLSRPFQKRNSDILRFTHAFLKTALHGADSKRAVNLLQAVVRNPILRGDYGKNSRKTADRKGFNRLMIDTAQLFKSIQARVKGRAARV